MIHFVVGCSVDLVPLATLELPLRPVPGAVVLREEEVVEGLPATDRLPRLREAALLVHGDPPAPSRLRVRHRVVRLAGAGYELCSPN
eukprot:gene2964-biopygen6120